MSNPQNPERAGIVAGIIMGLAGAAMMILPGLVGLDGMSGGYALGFIGLFLVIAGVVTAAVYRSRFVALEKILASQDILAQWRYTPDEWQRYAAAEFEQESSDKRSLWLLIAAISAVIGGVFYVADPEGGLVVAAILAGLLVVLAFFALAVPRLEYRRNRQSAGEAVIASNGIVLNGRLHVWDQWGSRLDGVSWVEGDPPVIAFDISYPGRSGRQSYTARVPVPRGQEAAARHVLARLAHWDAPDTATGEPE